MTITRRTLLTVSAAGVVLGALCFVPSAKTTADSSPHTGAQRTSTAAAERRADETYGSSSRSFAQAGSGSGLDSTPYLIGGTVLLGLGAAYVARSDRRTFSSAA